MLTRESMTEPTAAREERLREASLRYRRHVQDLLDRRADLQGVSKLADLDVPRAVGRLTGRLAWSNDHVDPIRSSFVVDASPALAFEVFTLGMGSWWDRGLHPDPDSFDGIAIGPEVGAPVSMVHGDSSHPWGNVTVWEPGARYAQTFWLAMDPAHPSTLERHVHGRGSRDPGGVRARRVERRERVVPRQVRRLGLPARPLPGGGGRDRLH